MDYSSILESDAFVKIDDGDFQPIDIIPDYEIPHHGLRERSAILKAMDFADLSLNRLLDFVYYDT